MSRAELFQLSLDPLNSPDKLVFIENSSHCFDQPLLGFSSLSVLAKAGVMTLDINTMDRLMKAAAIGDAEILRGVTDEIDVEKFSSYVMSSKELAAGNLIHRAVKKNNYTFLFEALRILPPDVIVKYICQVDTSQGSNPLHYAAKEGNIFIVKLLVNAYITASTALRNQVNKGTLPWLKKNSKGKTPLRCSLIKKTKETHEYIARYLVSREQHLFKSLGDLYPTSSTDVISTKALDKKGASILLCAMRDGFSLLAEQILTSGLPYSLNSAHDDPANPLHHAAKCNEQVSRLLLEKHPELIVKEPGSAGSVLNRAVEDNAAWLVKLMLIEEEGTSRNHPRSWNKACRRLIWHTNPSSSGDTPLHIAARKGYRDIAELLIQGYQSAIRDEAEEWDVPEAHPSNNYLGVSPFNIKNSEENIPLFEAGEYLLSVITFKLMSLKDKEDKNAYDIAEKNGCEKSKCLILEILVRTSAGDLLSWESQHKDKVHPSVLKIVHHFASRSEAMSEVVILESIRRLATKALTIFEKGLKKDANSHLKEAAERGEDWFVKLLLEGDSSLINDSTPAWLIACMKGHLSTVLAFVEQCDQQAFITLCQNNQQTPLHHIRLLQYEEYKILLSQQVMQKLNNQLDSDDATPLHRAIERSDVGLTKALLETEGIRLDILDRNGKTVLELLEEKCKANPEFFKLYKDLLGKPHMTQKLKSGVDSIEATSLLRAIERNDHKLTKELIDIKGIKLDLKNRDNKTALDLFEAKCVTDDVFFEIYKHLLGSAFMTQELKNRTDVNGATSLHRAIEQKNERLTKVLKETKGIKLDIKNNDGKTAFNLIEEHCSITSTNGYWYELYKNLLETSDRLQKIKHRKGNSRAIPLHIALEQKDQTLAKTLVQSNGIELTTKNRNGKTAPDMIDALCDENIQWYGLYEEMLYNPDYVHELKNRKIGVDRQTPLHRAIIKEDIKLAKTLLETKGVELDIKDTNGKTALHLLEERNDFQKWPKWAEMCREMRLDPSLRIFGFKYLQRRTSLKDMNHTLSVVAALLATITFAAGLTVPGGVDNEGTAILGTNLAFLVFSIANTLAMCSSLVVLFMMIGAMIWEAHPSATTLIDYCVLFLEVSLLGTTVAFMTGVYAIMAPKVQWAAIVVIVLCTIAFLGAFIFVILFWPFLYKRCKLAKDFLFGNCCGSKASSENGAPNIPGSVPTGTPTASSRRNARRSVTNANMQPTSRASDSLATAV
ncbi:uncharacterized protein LOC141656684 isoform X2 [Silene latifolia]|uniref:uncharacterized protein LOC141656684 isoform X2 n=1 Tax=Silene latifolia TaxID=37657 RepID=UPI003D788C5D